jgi:hypothetical protein
MPTPIWKIGLFTKLSKDKAECNDCKKNGITKHVFLLSDGSIKSLVRHMNSRLHVEEYSGRIRRIFKERLSNDRHVFCAQITSWLKEETEATSNQSNVDIEPLEPPSPKKAHI